MKALWMAVLLSAAASGQAADNARPTPASFAARETAIARFGSGDSGSWDAFFKDGIGDIDTLDAGERQFVAEKVQAAVGSFLQRTNRSPEFLAESTIQATHFGPPSDAQAAGRLSDALWFGALERIVGLLNPNQRETVESGLARYHRHLAIDAARLADLDQVWERLIASRDSANLVEVSISHRGLVSQFAAHGPDEASDLLADHYFQLEKGARADTEKRAALEERWFHDTRAMVDGLLPLRDAPNGATAQEASRLFPEIAGYLRPRTKEGGFDLERPAMDDALFSHVVERALGRKLIGLETGDPDVFQTGKGISAASFEEDVRRLRAVEASGFMPHFRAALLYHDAAKGDPASFARQLSDLSVDMAVVNKATAVLLRNKRYPFSRKTGLLANMNLPFDGGRRELLDELAYQLIALRGYPGQYIRGEITLEVFDPTLRWIRDNRRELERVLTPERPQALPELLTDMFYLFNVIDTAAVREGLFDDALRRQFVGFFARFERAIRLETTIPTEEPQDAREMRSLLQRRFESLRRSRLGQGEDPERIGQALAELSDPQIRDLWSLLEHYQGWFVENATAGLSPLSQIKLIVMSAVLAKMKGVDTSQPFHVNFTRMMATVSRERGQYDSYIVRIIESLLRRVSLEDVLAARGLEAFDLDHAGSRESLGAIDMNVDGQKAIGFDFALSPLAKSLVHLLSHFETKSQAVFHKILKELLDLFHIRLDEFDRVNNEAGYLGTMAGATDKERLVTFVQGPNVVEVGPAGGAVLELLEKAKRLGGKIRRIIGLDISEEAIKDLEIRKKRSGATYELVHGDAFELREVLGRKGISKVNTVIFCSILHEIYSYVVKNGKKFNLDSVRSIIGEALLALAPDGRLIIRDGVVPEDGESPQILEIKDQESFDFFQSYIANFEGRAIPFELLSNELAAGRPAKIRLMRQDAMEFMYTLTWGPASFPYEVREQYGVLKRSEYARMILETASALGITLKEIEVPEDLRSYLQKGYVNNLKDKVALFNADGSPSTFPPSNMIMVFQVAGPSQR